MDKRSLTKRRSGVFVILSIIAIGLLLTLSGCNCNGYYNGAWGFDDGGWQQDTGTGGAQPPVHQPYVRAFVRFPDGHIVHDPVVYAIEVNQALSWGFDTATGEFFLMDHFAAGKETAVFIQFTEPVEHLLAGGSSVFVSIYHQGAFVAQLDWIDLADDYSLWFQPRAMADVGSWAAGEHTFVVYIDGNVVAERHTMFHQATPMRMLSVPIIANYGGVIVHPHGNWVEGGGMIHGTFPVARADVEVILGATLDLSASRYDLNTDIGQYNVWRALANLQTRNRDYNAIMGFIPDPILLPGGGGVLGFTFGYPAAISSESDPEMLATVVHEIAHFFSIGDEYEGGSMNPLVNQPPYGQGGAEWFNRDQWVVGTHPAVQTNYSIGLTGTGSVIHPFQRPFYVEGRRFLHDVSSYMGIDAGDPWLTWVTSDIWIHKFRTFTGAAGGTVGAPVATRYTCTNCHMPMATLYFYVFNHDTNDFDFVGNQAPGPVVNTYIVCASGEVFIWYLEFRDHNTPSITARATPPSEVTMAVELRGLVGRDNTFTPYPWFTFETYSSMLDNQRSGEYAVYFYGADGSVLFTTYFDVNFYASLKMAGEGNRDVARPTVPIDLLLRFPVDTAAIAIYRGDIEIHFVELTQTAPTVQFIGLTENQNLGSSFTLNWEAEGERELFFEIWYSPADDEFHNIATDITGRSFTVDLSELPGTTMGYFYIYATDGVRTGSAYSPWIQVPYKAPLLLTDLSQVPRFRITEEFILDADIFDKQDGWLWDVDQVSWMLEGREFTSGSTLWVWPFELSSGNHTFELIAENSAGMTVSGNLTIYVENDTSDLPNDWSRDDIILALSQGFAGDLRRLDAPITRGRFATFMTTMFFMMQEGEWWEMYIPEYEEGVVTDGGQDSYDFWLMVHLGVMDAPGGRFNPNQPITELDAALIMYRVAAYADPQWFWDDADDDQILDWLFEIEALEDAGPNTLNDNESLTMRLAMVRLARFYDAVFDFDN
ncbi:MAG: hypothetical protein FWB74_03615 [Defluviitaleaceae bacterium]|nr:hypothetical protein [Defluviitaleaceae bacterium]